MFAREDYFLNGSTHVPNEGSMDFLGPKISQVPLDPQRVIPAGSSGPETYTFAKEARRRQGTQQVLNDMDGWTDGWEEDGQIYIRMDKRWMGGGLGWGLMDGWWEDEGIHNRWVVRQSQLNHQGSEGHPECCCLPADLHTSRLLSPSA